ncbi:hypothetical protein JHK85_025014 [Glycine max]|nr:hypothetical protein JHK85_025014 [Glycine max]
MMGKMEREILCLKIANDGVSEKGYILHSLLTLGFCDAQHKCRRYSVYYGVREELHARFFLHGLHQNSCLSSKLMGSYAKFGLLNISQKVFHFTEYLDSIIYNAILRNLHQFGEYEKTLLLYKEMARKSMYPDEESCNFVLRSCFSLYHE